MFNQNVKIWPLSEIIFYFCWRNSFLVVFNPLPLAMWIYPTIYLLYSIVNTNIYIYIYFNGKFCYRFVIFFFIYFNKIIINK